VRAGTSDIWLYDLERGFPTRFTFGPGAAITSIWSHDSSHIVFNSDGKGRLDLYQKASNGAGIDELLLADNSDKVPLSWSADGRFILFAVLNQSGSKLFILPLFGDRKPSRF